MDMISLIFIGVVGLAVFLLGFGVTSILSGATDPLRRRVAATASGSEGEAPRWQIDFARITAPFAKYITPTKDDERNSTRMRLIQAGFRSESAVRQFYGIKAVLALFLPVVAYFGVRWIPEMSSSMVMFACVAAALVGVRIPEMVVSRTRKKRIKRLRDGFPDALDLLVVCVESGLGLTPAIQRVSRELEISHGDLAAEFSLVNAEIRAGVERPTALRNLANRSGVEDINGLVALLIQTIRFGTSVADALRVYSEEFRDKRMQKAEEAAAKIGTKMIFPMVFCFFPSFFIVAIGPAVMRIIAAFASM